MKIKKRLVSILALTLSICVLINFIGVDTDADYDGNTFTEFIAMDEEGNIEVYSYDEIDTPDQEEIEELAIETEEDSVASTFIEIGLSILSSIFSFPQIEVSATDDEITYAVVIFPSNGNTTSYTNYETGSSGYTYGGMAPDAAYIGTVGDYTIFKQAGVIGKVKTSSISIISYEDFVAAGKVTSVYTCLNGKLYHKITTNLTAYASTQIVGYQQDYMKNNGEYYSYDGHYFYTSYKDMIDDYVAGTTSKAINPSDPYYSYYQFLSHRTTTNFTEEQIDTYINSKVSTSSKLYDTASTFVEMQDTYGTNAILMLGVAINESNWGNSTIAKTKNNLFGHAAYDTSTDSATGYSSVSESIKYHAYNFLSAGYIYIADWRYFGPHLGNKESGINVKYASDPYWGEKAAAYGYLIEDYYSDASYDYNTETIAIVSDIAYIYQEPNTESELIYTTANGSANSEVDNVGVIILEEVKGETIFGSNVWYKIQSDSALDDTRTYAMSAGIYDFDNDYGYIHSSEITYISNGEKVEVSYLAGDVNMDGTRSAMDYMLIKSHILGKNTLSGTALIIADVNGDGTISAMDYMLIKSHILGKTSLD